MSYAITIGEAMISCELRDPTECALLAQALVLNVPTVHHPLAPVFPGDGMTGDSNRRHTGYQQWHTFTKEAGMEALWRNQKAGILRSHPGIVLLTPEHLEVFSVARNVAAGATPGIPPGWCVCAACSPRATTPGIHTAYNSNLARLEWLAWWSQWALTNCRIPAIANS